MQWVHYGAGINPGPSPAPASGPTCTVERRTRPDSPIVPLHFLEEQVAMVTAGRGTQAVACDHITRFCALPTCELHRVANVARGACEQSHFAATMRDARQTTNDDFQGANSSPSSKSVPAALSVSPSPSSKDSCASAAVSPTQLEATPLRVRHKTLPFCLDLWGEGSDWG